MVTLISHRLGKPAVDDDLSPEDDTDSSIHHKKTDASTTTNTSSANSTKAVLNATAAVSTANATATVAPANATAAVSTANATVATTGGGKSHKKSSDRHSGSKGKHSDDDDDVSLPASHESGVPDRGAETQDDSDDITPPGNHDVLRCVCLRARGTSYARPSAGQRCTHAESKIQRCESRELRA